MILSNLSVVSGLLQFLLLFQLFLFVLCKCDLYSGVLFCNQRFHFKFSVNIIIVIQCFNSNNNKVWMIYFRPCFWGCPIFLFSTWLGLKKEKRYIDSSPYSFVKVDLLGFSVSTLSSTSTSLSLSSLSSVSTSSRWFFCWFIHHSRV